MRKLNTTVEFVRKQKQGRGYAEAMAKYDAFWRDPPSLTKAAKTDNLRRNDKRISLICLVVIAFCTLTAIVLVALGVL